jgi:hypothetical protein
MFARCNNAATRTLWHWSNGLGRLGLGIDEFESLDLRKAVICCVAHQYPEHKSAVVRLQVPADLYRILVPSWRAQCFLRFVFLLPCRTAHNLCEIPH